MIPRIHLRRVDNNSDTRDEEVVVEEEETFLGKSDTIQHLKLIHFSKTM